MADDATLCDILDEESSESEVDRDDVSNEPICPQSTVARYALDVFQDCMLFSDNGEFVHKFLKKISVSVEN